MRVRSLQVPWQQFDDARNRVFADTREHLAQKRFGIVKSRAALAGMPVGELIRQLIQQGLRASGAAGVAQRGRREPPPVIIASRGVPIPAVSPSERKRLETQEDEARCARPA